MYDYLNKFNRLKTVLIFCCVQFIKIQKDVPFGCRSIQIHGKPKRKKEQLAYSIHNHYSIVILSNSRNLRRVLANTISEITTSEVNAVNTATTSYTGIRRLLKCLKISLNGLRRRPGSWKASISRTDRCLEDVGHCFSTDL